MLKYLILTVVYILLYEITQPLRITIIIYIVIIIIIIIIIIYIIIIIIIIIKAYIWIP